jgi:hypothetical protein
MSRDNVITFELEENPKYKDSTSTPIPPQAPQQNTNIPTLQTSLNQNNTNNFIKKVEDFVKQYNPHVCILTPCYGGQCFINYVHCLLETYNVFRQFGISLTIEFCKNDSLVSRARNNLIAKAMHNPNKVTHMMFIDSDITWDPTDILKLLISNKSLVGGVYPLKKYNWNVLLEKENAVKSMLERKEKSQLKNNVTDEDMIQHNLLKYNINFWDNILTIDNNLTKVRHIATGFMMIKRNTIEQMAKAFPSTKYTDDVGYLHGDENEWAYALFDCGVEEGHYFSEDWLFCHRWTKMGGNVYLDVSINLKHTGIEDFNGSFIASVV